MHQRIVTQRTAMVMLMAMMLAASAAGADSRLFIHNNTDTVLRAHVRMGTPRLSREHWELQPKLIPPYQHLSILRFNRRSGLDTDRDYIFVVTLKPAERNGVFADLDFEIRIKVRRGLTTKRMWHSWRLGRQISPWITDKEWRTARWGLVEVRHRERAGSPDANVEFRFSAPSRPILRLPIEDPRWISTQPWEAHLSLAGPFFYDLHETKGDTEDQGERTSEGVKAGNCKTFDGHRGPHCYGGHSGTDYMLKSGFESMDTQNNYVVAARAGRVITVVDCYFDRCRLDGRTRPTCFGNNIRDADGRGMQENRIEIEHDDGTRTSYLHIKKNSALVGIGEYVECGDRIAEIGSSGRSVGPHLHFEVEVWSDDPRPLRADWHAIDPYQGEFTGNRTFWYRNGSQRLPSTECDPVQPSAQELGAPVPAPGRTLNKTCDRRGMGESRGSVSAGTTNDLDKYRAPYPYSLPPGKTADDIVGMGIAGSNDHSYVWLRDGTVSSGHSDDLDRFRAPYSYSLPAGKTPDDIVGMGIAGSKDHVYVWFGDGTVSSGTTDDLDLYRAPYRYSLPAGKRPSDIVGMGLAGSDDHVYVWFGDGTVSSGTTDDLDLYRAPYRYSLPAGKNPGHIVGMGLAGSDDHVYVWMRDRAARRSVLRESVPPRGGPR